MHPASPLLASLLFAVSFAFVRAQPADASVVSPNGELTVTVRLDAAGGARYDIARAGRPVMAESALGLIRDDADFAAGLRWAGASAPERVQARCELLTAKRRLNTYTANRRVFRFTAAGGQPFEIVFQVSDDGVAFRYLFPDTSDALHRIQEERSSFRLPAGAVAWLQPMAEAKTGWSQTNPSYEEYYQQEIPVGTLSPSPAGWVFPALFRTGDTWVALSETALGRTYCASRLRAASPDGEYRIGFPDARENIRGGPVQPESRLPWATPWRLLAIGSLPRVMESTLGTDLAEAPAAGAAPHAAPGKASWSWPLLGDPATVFDVQKRFIDYAADMGWSYTLIDALWDQQIGDERLKALVDHGRAVGVKILVWYNSAGDWNTAFQTPRDRLLTTESRAVEFARLKALGVAGVKIDFFGGDGQSVIGYYHDLLEETARAGLVVNFHGCTLPRGWQRTYPHLLTMEAVRGLEFITFEQSNADAAPTHAAMLPFTRNLFDPMDFTPVVLDRINDRIQRRTTAAFELALSVLFTSGLQHYAETPDGMAKAPAYVRDLLRRVPAVWDDVRFLDGYPGRHAVIARRAGARWYVAGINGQASPLPLQLDLSGLGARQGGTLIADGDDPLGFRRQSVAAAEAGSFRLTLPPHGGFVFVLE